MGGRLGDGVGGVVSPFSVPPPRPLEMAQTGQGYPGGVGVAPVGGGGGFGSYSEKRGHAHGPSADLQYGPQPTDYAYPDNPNLNPNASTGYLGVAPGTYHNSPPQSPPTTVSDTGSSSGSAYYSGGAPVRDPQYTAQGYPVPPGVGYGRQGAQMNQSNEYVGYLGPGVGPGQVFGQGQPPGRSLTQRTAQTTSSGSVYSQGGSNPSGGGWQGDVGAGRTNMSAKQREALGMGIANPGPNPEVDHDTRQEGQSSAVGGGVAVDAGRLVAIDAGREEIPPLYESLPIGERRP